MNDSLKQAASIGQFQTTLIISEIVITAIVFYGFYLIFNGFNKKQKAFKQQQEGKWSDWHYDWLAKTSNQLLFELQSLIPK